MNKELKKLLEFLDRTIIIGDGQLKTYDKITSTDLMIWAKMIRDIVYGNTLILDKEKLKKHCYNEELIRDEIMKDWVLRKRFIISEMMIMDDFLYKECKGNKEFEDSINNVLSNKLMEKFEKDFEVEEYE